jgi:hypothetical protein
VNKLILTLAAMVSSVALVACGGSDDEPPKVVATDTNVAVNPTVAAAVVSKPFVFTGGVPELGTTGSATTLSITSTATAPSFAINAANQQATGTMTFGSCIFTITASTFQPTHPLGVGKTITVNPCNIRVATAGLREDSPALERAVALQLGAALSTNTSVTVDVNEGGQLIISGQNVGTVTLTPISGS